MFLSVLADVVSLYGVHVYAYCLMENHYHLALAVPRSNLSRAMQYLNGVFTQRTNRRHRRTGRLYEARFRSLVIPRELYLRRVARYIALNPVRARLVPRPEAWEWSSYRATAGLVPVPEWLCLDWLSWAFPAESVPAAQARYVNYVNRSTARRTILTIPGCADERDDILKDLESLEHSDRWLPHTLAPSARPSLSDMFLGLHDRPQIRNLRIYEAHATYGYSLTEIAAALHLHPSTPGILLARLRRATA